MSSHPNSSGPMRIEEGRLIPMTMDQHIASLSRHFPIYAAALSRRPPPVARPAAPPRKASVDMKANMRRQLERQGLSPTMGPTDPRTSMHTEIARAGLKPNRTA